MTFDYGTIYDLRKDGLKFCICAKNRGTLECSTRVRTSASLLVKAVAVVL